MIPQQTWIFCSWKPGDICCNQNSESAVFWSLAAPHNVTVLGEIWLLHILEAHSICDSRGSNFDIYFYHISWSTKTMLLKVYIFLKEMTQVILLTDCCNNQDFEKKKKKEKRFWSTASRNVNRVLILYSCQVENTLATCINMSC